MPRKRRGNGEGSIYQRKDGLWVGQYKIETTKGPKTKYVYSKSRKDVATKLSKAIAERDSGIICDSGSLTLGAYLDRWLNSIEGTIRAGTFRRYEEATRIHIKPNLGNERLDKVNAFELQSLYRVKLDSDLSPRSVQIIHATLHKALKQAVKWQLLSRNVAQSVNPPKAQKKDINPLDEEQVKRLLKAVEGDWNPCISWPLPQGCA